MRKCKNESKDASQLAKTDNKASEPAILCSLVRRHHLEAFKNARHCQEAWQKTVINFKKLSSKSKESSLASSIVTCVLGLVFTFLQSCTKMCEDVQTSPKLQVTMEDLTSEEAILH